MRTSGQVFQKLKQARFRHIKKEVDALLRKSSRNCANNVLVSGAGEPLWVCKLDFQACGGKASDRADTCGSFTPAHGKDAVKKSLQDFFSTRSLPEIAIRFPDVAALLWVLDGEAHEEEETFEHSEDYLPGSVLAGEFHGLRFWADSSDAAAEISKAISSLEELENLRAERDRLFEEVSDQEAYMSRLESETSALTKQVQTLQGLLETERNQHQVVQDFYMQTLNSLQEGLRELSVQRAEIATVQKPFWKRLLG